MHTPASLMLLRVSIALAGLIIFNLRLRVAFRREPRGLSASLQPSDVSMVIPARNEAAALPELLGTLSASHGKPREVIVVDDHSSDATGTIARGWGARVVTPPALPPGWVGKPWACTAGAAEARAPILLFTDADTSHGPELLERAVLGLERRGADLVSVIPTHQLVTWWERLQGIFQLLLVVACRAGGPAAASGERCFCIGQFLLIRRTAYEQIGGHEAVRHRVAEDLGMARRVRECGLRYALLHLPGALLVRMYPGGLGDFARGWRRNFREGMPAVGGSGIVESVFVLGWLIDVPIWCIQAAFRADLHGFAYAFAAYLLTCLNIAHWQRELGAHRTWHALGYPLFVLLFVYVSLLATLDRALRRPVAWKGRALDASTLTDSKS